MNSPPLLPEATIEEIRDEIKKRYPQGGIFSFAEMNKEKVRLEAGWGADENQLYLAEELFNSVKEHMEIPPKDRRREGLNS